MPPSTTPARRIVSLAPSATEILFAAGCGDRVVAVTSYCEYPPEATMRPKVGSYLTPNYEAIAAARPDLVVMLPEHEDARRSLTSLGLPLLELDHRTIRGILDSVEAAGHLCGTTGRASALVSELEAVLVRVAERISGRARPRVVLSVSRGGERGFGTLSVAGPGGIYHDLLLHAGGRNAIPPGRVLHPALTAESLLRLDPDAIVELAPGFPEAAVIEREWTRLPSLQAVRRRRVHVFTDDFLPVPGARLVRFVDRLASALHPDAASAAPPGSGSATRLDAARLR